MTSWQFRTMSHGKINVIFFFSGLNYPQFHTFQYKNSFSVLLNYDVIAALSHVAQKMNTIFEFNGPFFLKFFIFHSFLPYCSWTKTGTQKETEVRNKNTYTAIGLGLFSKLSLSK